MQSVFDCFDQLAEGCLIVDREARVVMINDRYAARLGVDPAKVIGQEIESFLPNSLMRQVVVTGKPTLLEIFETHGQVFLVIRMPVRDDDGEVVGAMAETDCERVSSGERMLWRRPESRGAASSGVRTSRGMGGSINRDKAKA